MANAVVCYPLRDRKRGYGGCSRPLSLHEISHVPLCFPTSAPANSLTRPAEMISL